MQFDLLTPHQDSAHAAAKKIHLVSDKDDTGKRDLPEGLAALAAANEFKGEAGGVLAGADGVLLGIGDGRDSFAAAAASEKLPEGDYVFADAFESDRAARAACLGWLLGTYRFTRYKSGRASAARLVAPQGVDVAAVQRDAAAIGVARDLVNTPAGDMTPAALESVIYELGDSHSAAVESIVGDALIDRNFPMIHAVGRAAAVAPRLVDLTWGRADAPKVTLVGKGVCFDSGGLDIKGATGMALMKKDMGGAANAIALAGLIMESGLDVRLRLLVPAVENAIAGNAYRPGDILKSRKGLTVEIGNTDAEGRLVLADAMTLGGEEDPALMVTLATLTGAARVALGPDLPPFYCDDDAFASEVLTCAEQSYDPVWRMPLWSPYDAMLSSPIADINNSASGGFAGSITAALFLRRFAPENSVWGHFDIYAWRPKAAPGRPLGGEAQAIRALFDVLKRRYAA